MESLKPHLLEEAHEAVAALDSGDSDAIAEELGDVLLLVTMIAQIAEEALVLDLPHIMDAGMTKLIRRHPHVFGDIRLEGSGAVVRNWERIKADERALSTDGAGGSVLDGVPASMPALLAAQVIGRKVSTLGFDWPDSTGVWAKVREEIAELEAATTESHRLEEMGDLFFALVNLCRHQGLNAEEALRRANAKFRSRFQRVERLCAERGLDMLGMDITALDLLWDEAKITSGEGL
jgi:MazG family protein